MSRVALSLCPAAVAAMLGCDGDADRGAAPTGDPDAATPAGCVRAVAGGAVVDAPFSPAPGSLVIQGVTTPAQAPLDGVIGVASGSGAAPGELAAALHFAPDGTLEVRDGDRYRAEVRLTYQAGEPYAFTFFIDVPSRTYSVAVYAPHAPAPIELAHGFRLSSLSSFDRLAIAATGGQLDVCAVANVAPPQLRLIRDGSYRVLPLADGGALISDGATTARLDASGVRERSMVSSGALAVDAAGNIYIARIMAGALVVDSYTASFAKRWSVSRTAPSTTADAAVDAIAVTTAGELLVAIAEPTPRHLVWLGLDGSLHRTSDLPTGTTALGLGGNGYVLALALGLGGNAIELHDPSGRLVWRREVGGAFTIYRAAIAEDRSVVVAGNLAGEIDFGDGALSPYVDDAAGVYWTAFVAALDATGHTRFSEFVNGDATRGLATNGERIVLANQVWTERPWMQLQVWDPSGRVVASWGTRLTSEFFGGTGDLGDVAIASNGHIYANLRPTPRPLLDAAGVPVLVELAP